MSRVPGGLRRMLEDAIWKDTVAQVGNSKLLRTAARTPEREGEAATLYVPDMQRHFFDRFSPTISSWDNKLPDDVPQHGYLTRQALSPLYERYLQTQGPSVLAHSHPRGHLPTLSLQDVDEMGRWLYAKGKYGTPDLEMAVAQSESPLTWSTLGNIRMPFNEAQEVLTLRDIPHRFRSQVEELGSQLRDIPRYYDSDSEYLTTALGSRRLRNAGLAGGHQSFGAEFNRMLGPQFEELLMSLPTVD